VAMFLYPPLTHNVLSLAITYLLNAPFLRYLTPTLYEGLLCNLMNFKFVFYIQFCVNFYDSRLEELSECPLFCFNLYFYVCIESTIFIL
jgi:hypothetical protein